MKKIVLLFLVCTLAIIDVTAKLRVTTGDGTREYDLGMIENLVFVADNSDIVRPSAFDGEYDWPYNHGGQYVVKFINNDETVIGFDLKSLLNVEFGRTWVSINRLANSSAIESVYLLGLKEIIIEKVTDVGSVDDVEQNGKASVSFEGTTMKIVNLSPKSTILVFDVSGIQLDQVHADENGVACMDLEHLGEKIVLVKGEGVNLKIKIGKS